MWFHFKESIIDVWWCLPETQLPVLFPQFNSHCPRACRENSRARLFALNLNTHPSELKSVFCFFPKQFYFVAVLLQLRFRCVRVGVGGRASLALVAVSASLALSLSSSPFICVRLLVVLPLWFSIVLHFIHLSPGLVSISSYLRVRVVAWLWGGLGWGTLALMCLSPCLLVSILPTCSSGFGLSSACFLTCPRVGAFLPFQPRFGMLTCSTCCFWLSRRH